MAQTHATTPVAQRFIGLLRQAISAEDGTRMAGVTHHLPIVPRGGGVPRTFTVDLAPDDKGTFLVSCRELPDLLTFGKDEDEALAEQRSSRHLPA
jgi:hypothetical protein